VKRLYGFSITLLLVLICTNIATAYVTSEGTYVVTRLNNAQPIITEAMFQALGDFVSGEGINGPSMLRIPDWIAPENRTDPTAVYYLYFAHHSDKYIRMAWAADIEGPWHLYDVGAGVALGDRGVVDLGNSTWSIGNGIVIPNNHLASPCVFADDVNHRIIMYFHSGDELGNKFNLLEPIDLDGDGDLDILTCEEKQSRKISGLGIIWYENPLY